MSDSISQIKAELDRMLDGVADVYDQETDTYHPVNSDVKALTKALSVAVESLHYHKIGCPTKHEDEHWIQTAPSSNNADETLKSIADILSGGGEKK